MAGLLNNMIDQEQLQRAFASLNGLRQNLPDPGHVVYKDIIDIYHGELQRLNNQGFDVNEYRIPDSAFEAEVSSGNYLTGEVEYSGRSHIDARLLRIKLDSLIGLFTLLIKKQEIGFHG